MGVDGPLFKRALLGSLSWLGANHEEVNRLNVFPVPDGDTGTNMLLTLQSAGEDIRESEAREISKIAALAAHGSLMGARGNSGVILSQIFRGFAKHVQGRQQLTPAEPAAAKAGAAQAALELPEEGWGYCTEFLIEGGDMDVEKIREEIAAMGNSALIVGDPDLIRVHVHTNEPTKVLAYASGIGNLTKTKVDDMSKQHRVILQGATPGQNGASAPKAEAAAAQPRQNGVGLVAVAAGSGLSGIFKGLGTDAVVEGGQTMNPSTQDMLKAVESVPYQEVFLLPNNANVILAAGQVPELTKKRVHIVPTRTMPQGIAAVVAFNVGRPAEANQAAMEEAAKQVQTIEVTHAVRDSRAEGVRVKKGDVIALINDKLKHSGQDYGEVVSDAVRGIGPDGYELITVYRGREAKDADLSQLTEALQRDFPNLEVEVQDGGQQHYPFIVSVE